MNPKLGVHGAAAGCNPRGDTPPASGALLALGRRLEQIHAGADDVDFAVDTQTRLQSLDAPMVSLADHQ
jgi:hypothetical protein